MAKRTHKHRGGLNNLQGNRFETAFALSRIIEFGPKFFAGSGDLTIWEQFNCPVDDLRLRYVSQDCYYQLKDDQTITWGRKGGELRRDFVRQKALCEQHGRSKKNYRYRLHIIVSSEARRRSLIKKMPKALAKVTDVVLFASAQRPVELAPRSELQASLAAISASTRLSPTEKEHLVQAIHSAWTNSARDSGGGITFSRLLTDARALRAAPIRHAWQPVHPDWTKAEAVLSRIAGLQWSVDRGHFEWSYPPTDEGLVLDACGSVSFSRFIRRLLTEQPNSFELFEELLP